MLSIIICNVLFDFAIVGISHLAGTTLIFYCVKYGVGAAKKIKKSIKNNLNARPQKSQKVQLKFFVCNEIGCTPQVDSYFLPVLTCIDV